jgi:hypothetical protein
MCSQSCFPIECTANYIFFFQNVLPIMLFPRICC